VDYVIEIARTERGQMKHKSNSILDGGEKSSIRRLEIASAVEDDIQQRTVDF
jgi:hypothetical protein